MLNRLKRTGKTNTPPIDPLHKANPMYWQQRNFRRSILATMALVGMSLTTCCGFGQSSDKPASTSVDNTPSSQTLRPVAHCITSWKASSGESGEGILIAGSGETSFLLGFGSIWSQDGTTYSVRVPSLIEETTTDQEQVLPDPAVEFVAATPVTQESVGFHLLRIDDPRFANFATTLSPSVPEVGDRLNAYSPDEASHPFETAVVDLDDRRGYCICKSSLVFNSLPTVFLFDDFRRLVGFWKNPGFTAAHHPEDTADQKAFRLVVDDVWFLKEHGVPVADAIRKIGLQRQADRLDKFTRPIVSAGITISWSDEHDELQALSTKSGKWTTLKIPRQDIIYPTVGDNVASVPLTDGLAAFSGAKGTWDVLDVEGASRAKSKVTVDNNSQAVTVGPKNTYYVFSAESGVWTSPTDPNYRDTELTVTTAKSAQEVHDFLSTADCRGISFLPASGRRTKIIGVKRHVDRVAKLLREFGKAKTTSAAGLNGPGPGVLSVGQRSAAEEKSLQLAKQLRSSDNVSAADRDELKALVVEALDDRITHQRQLAKQLEERLSAIRTALAAREANRDKIIVRRVDELLDPEIAWSTLDDHVPSAAHAQSVASQPRAASTFASAPASVSSARIPQPSISNMQSTADIVHELNTRRNMVVTLGIQRIAKVNAELAEWQLPLQTLREKRDEPDLEAERRQSMIKSRQSELDRLRDSTRGSLSIWQNAWRDLESVIARKELELQATLLKAEHGRQELETLKPLMLAGAVSPRQLQQAALKLELAENEVQQAEVALAPYKAIEQDSPHLNPKTLDAANLLESPTSESDHSK